MDIRLILAGALFVVNLLSTIASALVPSVVLFTLVNGGGMLLAAGTAPSSSGKG